MSILIGADIVPTKSNLNLFEKGNALALVGQELLDILKQADYRIFNLEVPLSDTEKPILKCGPNLIAPRNAVNGLKSLGVDLFTLANNHILDQDVQGLDSTRKVLDEAGIAYLGVGNTLEEAAKPYVFENAEKKIGVYACAEHEFSIVSDTRPGANPYDPLEAFDHVAKLKEQCDFVIVLYHGGKEHYRYPSPNLQKVFRKFADKGADLVIAQHTHCIGCMEKYNGNTLVYGQGNFLFDSQNNEFWQTGMIVKIEDDFSICFIPILKQGNCVRLASGAEAENILNDFCERNEEINNPEILQKKYMKFSCEYIESYLKICYGNKSLLFKAINKLFRIISKKSFVNLHYNITKTFALRNIVECEAHHELFLFGLSTYKQGIFYDKI